MCHKYLNPALPFIAVIISLHILVTIRCQNLAVARNIPRVEGGIETSSEHEILPLCWRSSLQAISIRRPEVQGVVQS